MKEGTIPKGHQEEHISHIKGKGHQHDHIGYENGVGHQKFHGDSIPDGPDEEGMASLFLSPEETLANDESLIEEGEDDDFM